MTEDTDLVPIQYGCNPHAVWSVGPACTGAALGTSAALCELAVAAMQTAAAVDGVEYVLAPDDGMEVVSFSVVYL